MLSWKLHSVVAISVLITLTACSGKSAQYRELDQFLQAFDTELRACETLANGGKTHAANRANGEDCSRVVFKYSAAWEAKQSLLDHLSKTERDELVSRLTRLQARSLESGAQIKSMKVSVHGN